MAIIYSYPTVIPTTDDLVLGTDVNKSGNPTKNFTIGSIIDLVTAGAAGLGATIKLTTPPGDARDPIAPFANQPITNLSNLSGTGNVSGFASFSTAGGANITGSTGGGFTTFQSTAITGTLQTAAQQNITSLGSLTSLVINGPISGTNLITSTVLTGAQNNNVASTLAIKTYIDSQVGLFDTLAEVLANGNTTGGTSVVVSATDNITFTGTSKALFGNSQDLEINHDGIDSFITDLSTGDLRLRSDDAVKIQASTGGNTLATFTKGAGVDLYFANVKKFETLTGGAKVTGAFEATTLIKGANIDIAGYYEDSSGSKGTDGQLLSSSGSGTTTTWVTELPLYNWSLEGTTIPSGTAVTVTDGNNITTTWNAGTFDLTIAASGDGVTGTGVANQVTYWTGAQTVAGDTGMTYDATANDLTVANIIKADTFTTTAGTATWVTTVLDGFTSITSTAFVGALTGNASTATALFSPGTMSINGDFITSVAPTYTSGGGKTITASIADTVVTSKILTNLSTSTAQTITATDTILEAFGYLQSTITGLPSGLDYIGTWNANTNTPDLTAAATHIPGHYYIVSVAGTTNLDGITDWQIGDWAIRADATLNAWQKIDNTSTIEGTGTTNKIAKWTGTQTLGTGLISDDGSTVTIGNTGAFIVEGNTTLGNAVTDTVLVKGPATFDIAPNLQLGLGAAGLYGAAGQVLTSAGSASSAMTWTTPTVGTVESVAASITGNSIAITGSPIIGSGTLAFTFGGASTQYVNGAGNLTTFPATDNYDYWVLSDGTNTTNITTTGTAEFSGGTYITTSESAGVLTITHDATTRTDTTSADAPAFGGTFEAVSNITTNGTGHITAIDVATVTIPANPDMTAASAGTGGAHGLVVPSAAGDQLKFLRADATWVIPTNTEGVTAVTAVTPIVSSGGTTPEITHATSGVSAGTYDSVTVNDKGHVTAGTNPGGSGGGIFSGDQAITVAGGATLAFTLTRATTGTMVFDVWLTSETGTASSVAKKYVVAHSYNTTPVYNKILDTGPRGSADFNVSFIDSGVGATGTSCKCILTAVSDTQNIGYTVQVGHDSTNALTFTAAS